MEMGPPQSRCIILLARGKSLLANGVKPLVSLGLAALLVTASARPQSPGSAASASSISPQAKSSETPPPKPDENLAKNAYQTGRRAEQAGDWKAAYAAYSEAANLASASKEYPLFREHARFQLIQGLADLAERLVLSGDMAGAREQLRHALEIDPHYEIAIERLAELTPGAISDAPQKGPRLAGLPRLNPKPGARDFDYRGTTRGAYEEVGRQFGVTIAFDGDLADRSLRFRTPQVDFETAIMVLSRQTRTFTRVVDEHTLFVTDDTAQKVREYSAEIEKSLLLPASVTADEMNETVRLIREMTGITRTQLDAATRTLTLRSTEQNIALAQAVLDQIEQPRGELMLEIEILVVDRDAAHQLGITPPTSAKMFTLNPAEILHLQQAANNGTLLQVIQSIFGGSSVLGAAASGLGSVLPPLIAFGGGRTIFLATVPGASANFGQTLSVVRSAQRILLRAQDGKPATLFVGDRFPIDLGLLSSSLASSTTSLAAGLLAGLTLPRADYDVGTAPVALALADINGDGHVDLIVANNGDGKTDGTVSILLGVGDGTFGKQSLITIPGGTLPSTPTAVAVGDFDGDNNLDIAVADSSNNDVVILFGDGKGNFAAPTAATTYATGSNPVALLAADFNVDNIPDLAVVNHGIGAAQGTVSILLGSTKRGRTNTFLAKTDYTVGIAPSAITSAKLDDRNNTFIDLAVTNAADSTVSVLLGDGTGKFSLSPKGPYPTGKNPQGIAVADFNRDGHVDLAVADETDGNVSILLGNGDGTFATHTDFTAGSGPVGIFAGDFTGEGNPDLVVADSTGPNQDVLVGNGDGTFNIPLSLPTGNSPGAVAAADLDDDVTLDTVVTNKSSNTVTVTLDTLQSSSSSPSSQIGYPSAEYVDLGLKIKATPRLHGDDEVTLHLEFDIKSLAGSSVNGIPVLSNRTIDQTIRLRENETSVLSGLIESNKTRTVSGWPWTSTAPVVGYLTGEKTADTKDNEMLIVVTPRALRLPPHNPRTIYAGRGEPSTPAAPFTPPPAPPAQPGPPPGAQFPPTPPGGQPGGPPQSRPAQPE
jgi:Flp pilus assembly secretin CpaC